MEERTPELYIHNKHRSQTAKAGGGWNKVKQDVDQEGGLLAQQYVQWIASNVTDTFFYILHTASSKEEVISDIHHLGQ